MFKEFQGLPDAEEMPGRPWNLSPEEEGKLKEYYKVIISFLEGKAPEQTFGREHPDMEKEDGHKSGLFGRFRRGNKDEEQIAAEKRESKFEGGHEFVKAVFELKPDGIKQGLLSSIRGHHPDVLALRYLRARKWNVRKAIVMFVISMHWKFIDFKVQNVLEKGELGYMNEGNKEYMFQFRSHKNNLSNNDLKGRPISIIRPRFHRPKDQAEHIINEYTISNLETCDLLLSGPVDQGSIIFDLSHFGLSNMDYPFVKFLVACLEQHYPEVLGVLLIHNAPWFFQGIWKVIKPWFDPVVVSKINFTNSTSDLEKFISNENLPSNDFKGASGPNVAWDYIEPDPHENDIMNDTETRDRLQSEREAIFDEFISLTKEWIDDKDTNASRYRTAQKLRDNYWHLDPYVRARTLYDRIGMIQPPALPGEDREEVIKRLTTAQA